MATKVLPCNCKHEFQEKEYGKNLRLHNVSGDGKKNEARCTVCGTKHSY